MREINYLTRLKRPSSHRAAYVLWSSDASPAIRKGDQELRLSRYIKDMLSRNWSTTPGINVRIVKRPGDQEGFLASFQRAASQPSPDFERVFESVLGFRCAASQPSLEPSRVFKSMLSNGYAEGWMLAVVEIEPATVRMHYISQRLRHQRRRTIEEYRRKNPDAVIPDSEIVKDLPSHHEILTFRPPKVNLFETTMLFTTTCSDGTENRYWVDIRLFETIVTEETDLGIRQIRIPHDADPAEYDVEITEFE